MSNLVSVEWLKAHLNDDNLIILDATIPKVTANNNASRKEMIPNTLFFDIKNRFSDTTEKFPNTIPSESQFQVEAQLLGINKDSKIVVYDDLGIYSSPRVWWLFKTFGFNNVFILNGGLPEWKRLGNVIVSKYKEVLLIGSFIAKYKSNKVVFISAIPQASNNKKTTIIDARSSARFNCEVPEPRVGLRSGTLPNSVNLPFGLVLKNGLLKSKEDLKQVFSGLTQNTQFIFTCGSGITASILDLAAHEVGYTKTSLYDGSWTEYGTLIKD